MQLAGSFANKLAPKGLGGIGVNQRYLERSGVERPVAVAGIALNVAAGLAEFVRISEDPAFGDCCFGTLQDVGHFGL